MKGDFINKRLALIISLTLLVSILPEIILRELGGSIPAILPYIKLTGLLFAGIIYGYRKNSRILKYIIVLAVIVLTEIMTKTIFTSSI